MESSSNPHTDIHFYFKGPVYALCFLESPLRILVGEGPLLKIYEVETQKKVKEILVFP